MKVAVIGAGGVGGYFGGRLAHSGVDTTFVVRGSTLQALRSNGLQVQSIAGDFRLDHVQATDDIASIGKVDVVLVAVKAWQIAEIAPALRPLLHSDSCVVPMQNGIDAANQLREAIPRENVVGGLCAIVSFVEKPGVIRHAAYDPLIAFGEIDNRRTSRLENLAAAFTDAGVKAEIPADIAHALWTKFLFITPLSAIGAVTRVPTGTWRSIPELRELADTVLREIVSVGLAEGVSLDERAIELTWSRYDALDPASTASMQRDVMSGRPSELDAQLGAVLRRGQRYGIDVPASRMLYAALLPQERNARKVTPA